MDLPDGWEGYTVRSSGADLQCYRTGTGPPVLLAHGWSDSGLRWVPLADDFADEYRLVAYDARGHGRSDAPPTGYGLDDRIADLRTVARESGLDDPVLVGHSMGAVTVARAAAAHPELPRGVVLEDPAGVHDTPDDDPGERVERVRERVRRVAERSVEEVIAEEYGEFDPAQARRLAAASLELRPAAAEVFRDGYPSPLGDAFPEISPPTLVLRRDVDVETRVADLDAADSLPDGRLVHVPDAGHYVLGDEYDATAAELRAFLRRV